MTRAYPLDRLLAEHFAMARDIRQLDGASRQLLVENYSEFITAADSIKAMRANLGTVADDVQRVRNMMGSVAEQTSGMADRLEARAAEARELSRVQALLRRLHAVFELPRRMRAAVQADALEAAVSFYSDARPLLRKYGARPSFRTVCAEADAVAKDVAVLLKRRLTERKDSEEQCVLLLRKLGEPDDTLQHKYLQGRASRLRRILREASCVVDALALAASNASAAAAAAAAADPTTGGAVSGFGSSAVPHNSSGGAAAAVAAAAAAVAAAAAAAAAVPGPTTTGCVPRGELTTLGVDHPEAWGFTPPHQAATTAADASGAATTTSPGGDGATVAAPGEAAVLLAAPTLKAFMALLGEKVLGALQQTASNVDRFFLSNDGGSSGGGIGSGLTTATSSGGSATRAPLLALASEVADEYFGVVARACAGTACARAHGGARLFAPALPRDAPRPGGGGAARGGGNRGRRDSFASDDGPGSPPMGSSPPVSSSLMQRGGGGGGGGGSGAAAGWGADWGADAMMGALAQVVSDMTTLERDLPELRLTIRATDLARSAVARHIGCAFGGVIVRLMRGMVAVQAGLEEPGPNAAPLRAGFAALSALTMSGLDALLARCVRPYEDAVKQQLHGGAAAPAYAAATAGVRHSSGSTATPPRGGAHGSSHAPPAPRPSTPAAPSTPATPLPTALARALAQILPEVLQARTQWLFASLLASLAGLACVRIDGIGGGGGSSGSGVARGGSGGANGHAHPSPPGRKNSPTSTVDGHGHSHHAHSPYGVGHDGAAEPSPRLRLAQPSGWNGDDAVATAAPWRLHAASIGELATGWLPRSGGSGGAGELLPTLSEPHSGFLLLLAKLLSFLESTSVPWAAESVAGSTHRLCQGATSASSAAASSASAPPSQFLPGDLSRRLGAASAALLSAYVESHGRGLSLAVRKSVVSTPWLTHKEPRAPRAVCVLLLERLGGAEAEVVQLVDAGGQPLRPGGRLAGAGGTASVTQSFSGAAAGRGTAGLDAALALETGNVERTLARIFRDKVKVFGAVQFTRAHILAAIAGVALKSLVECIRLQALGRAGLQQLQLDCHHLRRPLNALTGGGGPATQAVDSLLDEVVAAGVERATDTQLLEPPVLDRILESARMSGEA
ncbi:hypothetical protein FOA52_014266 [Chlamydomonas sp. UWO 241]|nr:hypothetical protein FOA52_014266 [Chlamydomonas sp. UWO 241]